MLQRLGSGPAAMEAHSVLGSIFIEEKDQVAAMFDAPRNGRSGTGKPLVPGTAPAGNDFDQDAGETRRWQE